MRPDAQSGNARHHAWEFWQAEKRLPGDVSGRLTASDTGALLGACLGGLGMAQPLELYCREFLADGRLVQVLPDWAEETFPLFVYHHTPKLMSAKVRAFLAFVDELVR